jgi:WD40 repeat protein
MEHKANQDTNYSQNCLVSMSVYSEMMVELMFAESISPSVMIPENRLAILLDEVKDGWVQNCLYHNTAGSPSLYTDHVCDPDNFPMHSSLELRDHEDEVWYLAFSNDGSKLATAGLDRSVFIYDVNNSFECQHQLAEHEAGVCYIAWSPDDSKLITCTREPDNIARIWDVQVS